MCHIMYFIVMNLQRLEMLKFLECICLIGTFPEEVSIYTYVVK